MYILIVEDHPVFREILQGITSDLFPTATVVCAADGASAIRQLQAHAFTHLFLDLQLPDLDGFDVADTALMLFPGIRIITLTSQCDHYTVYRAEKRQFRGCVDKRSASAANFQQAITSVNAGGIYFSPSFLQQKQTRLNDTLSFDKILSDRELAILELIATPCNDQEIATVLRLSPETVEKHRFNILRKVGLHSTTALVRFAKTRGIVRFPVNFLPVSLPTVNSPNTFQPFGQILGEKPLSTLS